MSRNDCGVINAGWMVLLGGALLATGCATHSRTLTHFQTGESVVLAGTEPASLQFKPSGGKVEDVRSTYLAGRPATIHYEAGRDYVVTGSGGIQRVPGSRIPDYRTNVLYGQSDFDHSKFPGYGNKPCFAYVDYAHSEAWRQPAASTGMDAAVLPATRAKLKSGAALRIVAFGDSITAGGEASEPGLIFWERWAEALGRKYPQSKIAAINGATGGDTTVQGLKRLEEKVLAAQPDLVLVGFGMNDHNRPGFGVPLERFEANLKELVDRIRAGANAEVILFSAFPPNPNWHFGSHNMAAYAAVTERVAREKHVAFADVFGLWQQVAAHKKPEDLLANNINHPNDFGHWIYFRALWGLGL